LFTRYYKSKKAVNSFVGAFCAIAKSRIDSCSNWHLALRISYTRVIVFLFEGIFGTVLGDYAEFFNLIPLLFVVLVVGGMIILAVALSIGEHKEIPANVPSPIRVNVSYVKDIAVELATALSHYFHTPMKIKSNNIVVDIDESLFEEIRKFIEKFLERNKMSKHKLIWAGTQFVILRLIPMERMGLCQCAHCGALFNDPTVETYHRRLHYFK